MLKRFFKSPLRLLFFFNAIYILLYSVAIDRIPMIAIDESWSAMIALNHWGKQDYLYSFNYGENIFFCYFYLLALFLDNFGVSLANVRGFSILIGGISLNVFYALLCLFTQKKRILFIGMSLLITHNLFLVFMRWGRLEALLILFVVTFLYFLSYAVVYKKEAALFFAGIFCSLCVLTHPFNLIFMSLVLALLWRFNLRIKQSYLYFLSGCFLIFIIFFSNLIFLNLDYAKNELLNDSLNRSLFSSKDTYVLKQVLDNFIVFFQSYTLGIKRLYIFCFEIFVLCFCSIRYRTQSFCSNLSLIGIGTFIISMIFLMPFRARFMGAVVLIVLVLSLLMLMNEKGKLKKLLSVLLSLYMMNHMIGDFYFCYLHRHNTSYQDIANHLQAAIPSKAKVLAPIQFWLALPQHTVLTEVHDEFRLKGLSAKKASQKALEESDYFVFSPYFLKDVSPTSGERPVNVKLSESEFLLSLQTATLKSQEWEAILKIKAHPYKEIGVYKKIQRGINE